MEKNNNKEKNKKHKETIDKYVESQLSVVSKIISNAIKYSSSAEVKSFIDFIEKNIDDMGSYDSELPPTIKETIQNIIKFLTTNQYKKLIKYIEEKPVKELEKVIYDFLNLEYKMLENTYNGFLSFIIDKVHKKNKGNNEIKPESQAFYPKNKNK